MTSPKPTLAFFGATGGCTCAALVLSLQANYSCTALVRTPSKLTSLLDAAGIPSSTLTSNLKVIQGDIKDISAIKKTLFINSTLVDTIVFGVGALPKFQPNPIRPATLADPTICEDGMKTVLAALKEITNSSEGREGSKKPLMAVISTTGISRGKRDVPLAMAPLYHWLGAVPHADKRAMEDLLISTTSSSATNNPLRGLIVVRPSMLSDGKREGKEKVRVGVEGPNGEVVDEKNGPVVGYSISRQDVGGWIFEQVVEGRGKGWEGKMVSLSY